MADRTALAPGKWVLMLRPDFSVSEKGEAPPYLSLSLRCLQSRGPAGGEVDCVCVCDGQSDRHQAGGEHKVDGPRQADGWVAKADRSRSVGRQDDGQ